jgi:hypothetical protein
MIDRSARKLAKAMKRQLIDDGLIMDPAKRPPLYRFKWVWGRLSGEVVADTKSEARSLIKRSLLGVTPNKRLPQGVVITRHTNLDYQQGVSQTIENLQTIAGQDQSSTDVRADNSITDGGDGG